MKIQNFYPTPETALQLQPEELAIFVLRHIDQLYKAGEHASIIRGNYVSSSEIDRYAGGLSNDISRALTEAWIWLEKELMIAPNPRGHGQSVYVTRRGQQLLELEGTDIGKYLKGKLIPEAVLDPTLASKVHHLFIRGDYDIAVLQAFKEVEVRVRTAANLPHKFIGVPLMREAFHLEKGVLTDYTQEPSEREATSALFSGAIGLFKNPSSHRDVNWEDASECVELIYLANYLLRLVDRRQQRSTE